MTKTPRSKELEAELRCLESEIIPLRRAYWASHSRTEVDRIQEQLNKMSKRIEELPLEILLAERRERTDADGDPVGPDGYTKGEWVRFDPMDMPKSALRGTLYSGSQAIVGQVISYRAGRYMLRDSNGFTFSVKRSWMADPKSGRIDSVRNDIDALIEGARALAARIDAALRWKMTVAGSYSLEGTDWMVQKAEGEQTAPGYRWMASHPDIGDFSRNTLREAQQMAESKSRG